MLPALLGNEASNLLPAVIGRLTTTWADEYVRWLDRDLLARRYVNVWTDGVYLRARISQMQIGLLADVLTAIHPALMQLVIDGTTRAAFVAT